MAKVHQLFMNYAVHLNLGYGQNKSYEGYMGGIDT